MTFQFGQDQELDELRTSHNITKILTTPFGKKEGCDHDNRSNNNRGARVLSSSPSFHFSSSSLKSKTEKYLNKGGVNKL